MYWVALVPLLGMPLGALYGHFYSLTALRCPHCGIKGYNRSVCLACGTLREDTP